MATVHGVAESDTTDRTSPARTWLVPEYWGLPRCSVIKNLPANTGDMGLIPGSGRSPGERRGHPLQCPCLGNAMDRGAWWAAVHGAAKESDKT